MDPFSLEQWIPFENDLSLCFRTPGRVETKAGAKLLAKFPARPRRIRTGRNGWRPPGSWPTTEGWTS
jgi:hypothetical protein